MRQKIPLLLGLACFALALISCGKSDGGAEQSCAGPDCSESTINAPVNPADGGNPSANPSVPGPAYRFPAFAPSWGLTQALFVKAEAYYEANMASIPNTRYVAIVDFNKRSSEKRLFLFDLSTGAVEMHNVAHGKNSDPGNTGYATLFSNEENSLESSLGFYLTLGTYQGENGYSLRLRGLDSTNSNAEARAIVMHPAAYVQEANSYAGRSWGCPALDPSVSQTVIDKLKNGALLLLDR